MLKTYVGIVRDHSGSMTGIRGPAARDFNSTIETIKHEASGQDTIVTVVECGIGRGRDDVRVPVRNSSVVAMQPIAESAYETTGAGTPLFDSVNRAITELERAPDADDKSVAFLVTVITDGGENASTISGAGLARKIHDLQMTDRWSFVFRVPKGGARALTSLGIPEGNILEWDGRTGDSLTKSSQAASAGFADYFRARGTGARSTKSFYASAADLTVNDVKRNLSDISGQVQLFPISPVEHGEQIRDVVEDRLRGKPMLKGAAFYELTKREKEVQDYKLIAVRHRRTGAVYAGADARSMLGLPTAGTISLAPGQAGDFDIFVQSTSTNRKVGGSHLLYWPQVGVPYKEGVSAR